MPTSMRQVPGSVKERALPDYRRPQCYCDDGKRREEPQVLTEKFDVGASWA